MTNYAMSKVGGDTKGSEKKIIQTREQQYEKEMGKLIAQKNDVAKAIANLKKESPYYLRGGKTIGRKRRRSKTMKRKLSR